MKIVILNDFFANESHFKRLQKLGQVTHFQNTDNLRDAIERAKNADIIIGDQFLVTFNSEFFKSSKNLKLLALNTITFSDVDLLAASQQGVKVCNIPGFSAQAVAELTLGVIFALNRKIALMDRLMRENPFELIPDNKEHHKFMGYDLKGRVLGIVGFGSIGKIMAELGKGIGMKVIGYNRTPKLIVDVKMVGLDELFKTADVVSIHIAENEETKKIVSEERLHHMKPSALLVNISKPGLTNLDLVYTAIKNKKFAGFGIDAGGKMPNSHPLLKEENVVITSHAGSFTIESCFENMPNMILQNVESFVYGNPQNIVNPEYGKA